jgi:NADH-quinone oxidoreductase subunit F
MTKPLSIGELEWYRNKILAQEDEGKTRVHVCMTGCRAYGAAEFKTALEDEIKGQGLPPDATVCVQKHRSYPLNR